MEYNSAADAQSVFDKEGDVELDGHTLFIDFAAKRSSIDFGGGWEKDLELDESSKNLHNLSVYPVSICTEILDFAQHNFKKCWLRKNVFKLISKIKP